MKKVAIVVPFYKSTLNAFEKIAIQQCASILNTHPIIAVKPGNLILPPETEQLKLKDTVSFDVDYFKDIAGYNRLMLSSEFYQRFLEYEYILIYQLDCFVFKDELGYWCNLNYDYIGAPWIKKTYHKTPPGLWLVKLQKLMRRFYPEKKAGNIKYQLENKVGNGGFSLRRVQKFYDISVEMNAQADFYLAQSGHFYNEDVFWSFEVNLHKQLLNIPPCSVAIKFAFEVPPRTPKILKDQNLPFGCHDWDEYIDYWQPIFKRYGYDI